MDAWKRKAMRPHKRSRACTRRKYLVLCIASICLWAMTAWLRRLLPRLHTSSSFREPPKVERDKAAEQELPLLLSVYGTEDSETVMQEEGPSPAEAVTAEPQRALSHAAEQQPHADTSNPEGKHDEAKQCIPAEWPEGRVYPKAFIIGHSKTGSTYFFNTLVQHPQMVKAAKKEINFFANTDRIYTDSLQPYIDLFPARNATRNNRMKYGIDASIEYVSRPDARDRLHAAFPCGKLIVLMRDPTVRYYSYFQHIKRACLRTPTSHICKLNTTLAEYVDSDLKRMDEEYKRVGFTPEVQASGVSFFSLARQKTPLRELKPARALAMGLYYSRLIEWLDVWPRSQLLIVNSELLFEEATFHSTMKEVTEFLELSPYNYQVLPPRIVVKDASHTTPGDYGAMPEPFQSLVRAFYAPDLKLLEARFGVRFTGKFME